MGSISLSKNKNLKKHVAAIRVSARIGLLERKMWNIMLLNSYEDLMTSQRHQVKISDLSELVGYNSRDVDHLENCLKNLQDVKVVWNVGGDDIKNLNRGSIPLLGAFEMKDGVINYEYSSMLSEMLYKPEIYQTINLYHQSLFKTSYGLALWENCMRFSSVGTTGFSPVEEWRQLLGATAKSYTTYTNFSKFVLKQAIIEVNSVSNIGIKLKVKRHNRKIVEIGFDIERKKDFELIEAIDKIKETKEYQDLMTNGLSKVQALKFMQEYEKEYIREKIDIVLSMKKEGRIKVSASGLLVSAIQKDWKNEKVIDAKLLEKEKFILVEKEKLEKKAQKESTDKKEFYKKARKEFLEKLSDKEKENLLEKIIKENNISSFALESIKKKGFDSPHIFSSLNKIIDESS